MTKPLANPVVASDQAIDKYRIKREPYYLPIKNELQATHGLGVSPCK